MKKIVAIILALTFFFGIFALSLDSAADAKYKKSRIVRKKYKTSYRRSYKKRGFYRYKRKPVKLYQEIYLSPKISEGDHLKIEAGLKDLGASSIKLDQARNSILVQYSSKTLSAVDIIQFLKNLEYTVVSID